MELQDLFEEVYRTGRWGRENLEVAVSYVREKGGEKAEAVVEQMLATLLGEPEAEEVMQSVGAKLRAEGLKEGLARGRVKGRAEGKAEGKAEGRVEIRIEALLEVLEARGIRVDARSRQRIQRCTDLGQLKQWFTRALSATRLSDVFNPRAS